MCISSVVRGWRVIFRGQLIWNTKQWCNLLRFLSGCVASAHRPRLWGIRDQINLPPPPPPLPYLQLPPSLLCYALFHCPCSCYWNSLWKHSSPQKAVIPLNSPHTQRERGHCVLHSLISLYLLALKVLKIFKNGNKGDQMLTWEGSSSSSWVYSPSPEERPRALWPILSHWSQYWTLFFHKPHILPGFWHWNGISQSVRENELSPRRLPISATLSCYSNQINRIYMWNWSPTFFLSSTHHSQHFHSIPLQRLCNPVSLISSRPSSRLLMNAVQSRGGRSESERKKGKWWYTSGLMKTRVKAKR